MARGRGRRSQAHRGRSLVIAGERQPASIHLLAHAINAQLGNVGKTVRYIPPVTVRRKEQQQSLAELVDDAQQGRVELLLVCDANPVLTAPAELEFVERLQRVSLRVHFGLYQDETAEQCHWHLPAAHYLETWSDARAFDGTATIVQPLIEPLYQGRSLHEVISLLGAGVSTPDRELVRQTWRRHWQENAGKHQDRDQDKPDRDNDDEQDGAFEEFEIYWQSAVHDGIVPDTASAAKDVSLADDWQDRLTSFARDERRMSSHVREDSQRDGALDLIFLPDPTLYDGRYANNGWLQELPKPLTKLAWGNAAIMSPQTAAQLGLEMGDYAHGGEHGGYYQPVVELQLGERMIHAPLWIMPGHVDGTVALYLGHGRRAHGRIGGDGSEAVGCNAYALRTAAEPWFARGLRVVKTDATQLVACVQQHHSLEDRDAVRAATLAQYREDVHSAAEPSERLIEEVRMPAPRALEPLRALRLRDAEAQVGHVDRSHGLHRLRSLHGRLPGREQHSGGRARASCGRARDALAARRSLRTRRRRCAGRLLLSAGSVHAL